MLGYSEENDPVYQLTGLKASGYGLATFFIISGFLVTRSLCNRKNLWQFAKARFLRLYPALVFTLLFCVLVIGAGFTTWTMERYLSSEQTVGFISSNLYMPVIHKTLSLPGVFEDHPDKKINGPLWTLAWESIFYIILGVMGLTKIIKYRPAMVVIALSAILFFILSQDNIIAVNKEIVVGVGLGALFASGACLYLYRHQVTLGWPVLFGLIVSVILIGPFLDDHHFNTLKYLSLVYVVIALAYLPKGKMLQFNRLGDYSYGMYVYHYPVMHSLISLTKVDSPYLLFFATLSLTLPLSILSWHFIEKRALSYK
jgi:peptidoglycan/LPS O-acetylase OafA/YrhL